MGVPSNTFQTYSSAGDVEDMGAIIYNTDPFDTPVMNSMETVPAIARVHIWQTDVLGSGSQNIAPEGDDPTSQSITATTELSNTCQIADYAVQVSGTQQAIMKAGRGDELSYLIAKYGKKMRNDMENDLCDNNIEATGSSGTGAETGGIPTWITTNESTTGSAGGTGDTARTDGTQRAFNESLLKTVLASCFTNGGDPDLIAVGAFNKQKFSGFTGNATREVQASEEKLFASIDVYKSDFGELRVVPSRNSRARDCLILETAMWKVAFLRDFQVSILAKTGDSEKAQLLAEFALEASDQSASGIVADLTTS